MTKIIGIIENNCITGVKYGEIEILDKTAPNGNPNKSIQQASRSVIELQKLRNARIRKNNTKHK
ncbi:MAG: hypothetical protein NC311_03450 [Muribaculaceae bacterium]|nr:hypothetical protein [Muribaculaceae bacterium]